MTRSQLGPSVNYFTLVSVIFPLPSQDLHLTGLDFAALGAILSRTGHFPVIARYQKSRR